MTPVKRSLAALVTLLLAAPPRAEEPAKKWKDSAEASFVNATGNSRTTTTAAKNTFLYDFTALTQLEVNGSALGSKTRGQVTAEQYEAGEKVQHKVTDRDYVFEKYRWVKNRFAGLAHQHLATLGVGRELWKTKRNLLVAEASPGYVNEERVNAPRRDFASVRGYAKYSFDFTESSKFSQDGELIQSLEDNRDNRITTETALVAALSDRFSIKNSLTWRHNGRPPPGAVKDDTLISVALIANF